MKTPFLSIICARKEKPDIAQKLFETVIRNSLVALIVKKRLGFSDYLFTKKPSCIFRGKGISIFGLANDKNLKEAEDILLSMPLWHMPIFHIWIGPSDLMEIVSKLSKKDMEISDLEKIIKQHILCTIQPLDEELEFFSERDNIREIFAKAFSK